MSNNTKRLDYVLVHLGLGSRKSIKKLIKNSEVIVNNIRVTDSSTHIKLDDKIFIDGRQIHFKKYYYYMMNKPSGVISATYDKRQKTIIDLLLDIDKNKNLFPVGRLDKDTEGLILLTTNGKLTYNLISPDKNKLKTYIVEIDQEINNNDLDNIQNGVILENGYKTLPCKVELIDNNPKLIKISITEGKFHQIKRMFLSIGKNVIYLKRISIDTLILDENLKVGEYRELTTDEIYELLRSNDI